MRQIDLKSLRYFVAVAEERNVGRAALKLHIAQPSLSVQIKHLEDALGVSLFRRGAKGMEITDAGSALFARAKEALLLANDGVDAARAIGRGHMGRLTIGTMLVLSYDLLPGVAALLRMRLPNIDVQYSEITASSGIDAVVNATVNVALCMPPIVAPSVSTSTLGSEPLMVVLREDSPLAALQAVPLNALNGVARIGLSVLGGDNERSIVAMLLGEHGVTMPISHRVETVTTAMALALAGEGCALLPACARFGSPRELVFRPLADGGASLDVAVCWRSDLQSELTRQFLAIAQDAFDGRRRFIGPGAPGV